MTADAAQLATADRRARRTLTVIEHMQSENAQEWDRTIKTFSRPRYELPGGEVIEGRDDVMAYWVNGRANMPDQRNELIAITHHDECVVLEFWLRGTPPASDGGQAKGFEVKLWAIFDFDEDDLMTNERVYPQPPTDEQINAGSATAAG